MSGLRAISHDSADVNSTTRPKSLSVHPDIFDDGDPHSQDKNCIALIRAVLSRAILDATGTGLSEDNESQDKKLAKIFFRRRSRLPFDWGWIIDALELSEDQAQKIERACIPEISLKRTTRTRETVVGIFAACPRRNDRA